MIDPSSSIRRRRAAVVAVLLAMSLAPSTSALSDPAEATRTVRVTAGEHGEYSRVVFALGGADYRTVPEAEGLRVLVPGAPVAFEYDDVYPKRRAHRVIGADPASGPDGAALRLRFGCDCTTRSFLLDDKLVVDIFDGASDAADALAADDPPAVIPASATDRRTDAPAPAAVRARPTGADERQQPRPEFLRRVENLANPVPEPPPAPTDASAADGFDQDHLRRMLEWAVDHGHLTKASPEDGGPAPSQPSEGDGPTVSGVIPAPSDPPPPLASSTGATRSPMKAAQSGAGGACPDARALDMAALGGRDAFDAELASRQDALSRALASGRGAVQAQYALAGFYLARLMPQEALEALRKADGQREAPARGWLEAAALILADRPDEVAAGEFLDSPCKGADARLWRSVVLAAHGLIAQDAFDDGVILERLTAYPPDLRVELGLRLAEAAMSAAEPATLEHLLDLVQRAPLMGETRARLLFLRGRFAAEHGDFAGATASWRAAAQLPGKGGAQATLALLQTDLDDDQLDRSAALLELEGLAYDWRHDPLQLPIARLIAAIYEQQDRVADALGALEEVALASPGLPDGRAAARAATDLMRRTYVDGPSVLSADRLAAFWRYEGFVPPGPEGADIRLAFAQALIANGLPGMAVGLLEPIAGNADRPLADRAVDALAEAYIAAHQPAEALDLLRTAGQEPATGPRRNLLAARALAALGRFAEAAGVLHGATAGRARRLQADYLWKAGLWEKSVAAYRARLDERQDGNDAERDVIRLAAAAYMADQPAMLDDLSTEGTGEPRIASAFAPLPASAPASAPAPGSRAARAAAARLVEQARSLGKLAERYGLEEPAAR